MEGQLSIFDLLPPPSALDDLPEEEMVREVGRRIGKTFERIEWKDGEYDYRCKTGKLILSICYETYLTIDEQNGKRFIGVGYDNKADHSGGGSPCDSVDEAVGYFKRVLERTKEGKK